MTKSTKANLVIKVTLPNLVQLNSLKKKQKNKKTWDKFVNLNGLMRLLDDQQLVVRLLRWVAWEQLIKPADVAPFRKIMLSHMIIVAFAFLKQVFIQASVLRVVETHRP